MMKLNNQATVVAMLSAIGIASSASASAAASFHELLTSKPRMLQVKGFSRECKTDTEAIDAAFKSAVNDAMNSCPQGQTTSTSLNATTIKIDYSVCDPMFTDTLTKACTGK